MVNYYAICGFSGVGKSTAAQKSRYVVDMESSAYSRLWNNGVDGGKNPAFPGNYIDGLEQLGREGCGKVFLLSCHKEVRDELKKRGIPYIIVLPRYAHKNEYLRRYLKRGSDIEFIESMNNGWVEMHISCEEDSAPKIYLEEGEYITDVLPMM
jgi:hypothetical protein